MLEFLIQLTFAYMLYEHNKVIKKKKQNISEMQTYDISEGWY